MLKNILIIVLLILSGFNTNAQSQNNKIIENMEPKILLLGRNLDVMKILKDIDEAAIMWNKTKDLKYKNRFIS